MSNLIAPFAIPWAEAVCEEFEKRTGQKMSFMPPKQKLIGKKKHPYISIHYFTPDWKFEDAECTSQSVIMNHHSFHAVVVNNLVSSWEHQNKSL